VNLGDILLHSLSDGFFGLDGGAMFGVVPKPVWERTNPPDERNRIRLALRPLLVVTAKERVLIDTGIGDKWDARNTDIYRIEHTDTIDSSLARAGFHPEDITKVVLTHLHFDHAGAATKLNSSGKPVPRFPNARYYVQQREWEAALNPNRRSKASYLPQDFLPLQEAGLLELVDGNSELVPGLELVLTGGHTPGHQIAVISANPEFRIQRPECRIRSSPLPSPHRGEGERSKGEEAVGGRRLADSGHRTAVFWGDLIPTRSHLATPYIMGYDLLPLETMAQKEKLVGLAVAGRWASFFEHDPDSASGVIEEENGKPFLRPFAD